MQFVLASLSGWFLLGYGASKIFGGKKEEVVFCYYYNMTTLLLWFYYNMTTLLKCSQPSEICSLLLDYLWANTATKAERKKKMVQNHNWRENIMCPHEMPKYGSGDPMKGEL